MVCGLLSSFFPFRISISIFNSSNSWSVSYKNLLPEKKGKYNRSWNSKEKTLKFHKYYLRMHWLLLCFKEMDLRPNRLFHSVKLSSHGTDFMGQLFCSLWLNSYIFSIIHQKIQQFHHKQKCFGYTLILGKKLKILLSGAINRKCKTLNPSISLTYLAYGIITSNHQSSMSSEHCRGWKRSKWKPKKSQTTAKA